MKKLLLFTLLCPLYTFTMSAPSLFWAGVFYGATKAACYASTPAPEKEGEKPSLLKNIAYGMTHPRPEVEQTAKIAGQAGFIASIFLPRVPGT